jgi:uncharacterized membrane protein
MKIVNFIKGNSTVLIYLVLSIFSILPFFSNGFFKVHDDTQVVRIYEMSKALSDGMFPVRWVEDLGYGFGYAIFNFYSVLPYYLGGLITNLGIDVLLSTKIVFAGALVLSGISMFVLVKDIFGKLPALASSIIYLYFPYHAVNTYVRGDLAEIYAYALTPLVFLGLLRIHSNDDKSLKRGYILLSSVSLAQVIVSHNLSAFMLFLFIGGFILHSLILGKNKVRLAVSYTTILVLAFLLSAFYSIPAIFEMKYSNVLSQIGGPSLIRDNFVCLTQLWDSPWGFGGSAPGCVDGMSFKLGKINIILAFLALVLFLFNLKKVKDKLFITSLSFLFLAFSIFLTHEYSMILWTLPYMEFLQFPWRFLNFTGLFLSIVAGFLVWKVGEQFGAKLSLILTSIIVALTLFYNAGLFSPQSIMDLETSFYTDGKYIKWDVSRISDEYLPHNFTKPKSENDIRSSVFDIVEGSGTVETLEKKTQAAKARINLDSDGIVRVNIAFFPAWNIRVNNDKTHYIVRDDGMYIGASKGTHLIEAKFEETGIEKIANVLSLIGLLITAVVIIGKPNFYAKKTS